MAEVRVELFDGEAFLTRLDGERIELRCGRAYAPGTPLSGALAGGQALELKVARCVRRDEHFVVAGRLVNATRALHRRIETQLGG